MTKDKLKQILKDNLTLETKLSLRDIEEVTTLIIKFDGEIISEIVIHSNLDEFYE